MKRISIVLMLLVLISNLLLSESYRFSDIKKQKFGKPKRTGILSFYSGTASYKGYSASNLTIASASYEKFINENTPFSWNIDLNLWIANSAIFYYSMNLFLHLSRNSSVDPYLSLGILNAYEDGNNIYDFTGTVGINLWLDKNFGLKTQIRTFLMSGFDLLEINFGLNFNI